MRIRNVVVSYLAAAFVVFAALAMGCSKKVNPDDLKQLQQEACACRDKTCAAKLTKKLEDTLGDASEADVGTDGKAIAMDIAMCLAEAETGLKLGGK